MLVTYDFRLVLLSITVAILSSHAGILLLSPKKREVFSYKSKLIGGAIIIGGGIWTMHFVGMLALNAPMPIDYAVLPTLISALIAFVLTGLSLYCATSGIMKGSGLLCGAVLMGIGIASMHYTGMEALRSVCHPTYSPAGAVLAVALGIGASWLALTSMRASYRRKRIAWLAAVFLGLAISSMHYVAMLTTQFTYLDKAIAVPNLVVNSTLIACIVAVAVFLVIDVFLLLILPTAREPQAEAPANAPEPVPAAAQIIQEQFSALHDPQTVRVSSRDQQTYVDIDDILYISADGHYTQVGFVDTNGSVLQQICDRPLSVLADALKGHDIQQCHRSHLVNLRRVRAIKRLGERGLVVFDIKGSPEIPISRSSLGSLSARLDKVQNAV